jgi:hypothetical protein
MARCLFTPTKMKNDVGTEKTSEANSPITLDSRNPSFLMCLLERDKIQIFTDKINIMICISY